MGRARRRVYRCRSRAAGWVGMVAAGISGGDAPFVVAHSSGLESRLCGRRHQHCNPGRSLAGTAHRQLVLPVKL